jgi:hypothetical protein
MFSFDEETFKFKRFDAAREKKKRNCPPIDPYSIIMGLVWAN